MASEASSDSSLLTRSAVIKLLHQETKPWASIQDENRISFSTYLIAKLIVSGILDAFKLIEEI